MVLDRISSLHRTPAIHLNHPISMPRRSINQARTQMSSLYQRRSKTIMRVVRYDLYILKPPSGSPCAENLLYPPGESSQGERLSIAVHRRSTDTRPNSGIFSLTTLQLLYVMLRGDRPFSAHCSARHYQTVQEGVHGGCPATATNFQHCFSCR